MLSWMWNEPDVWDPSYRRVVVTLNGSVRAKTQLNTDGTPTHVNVALVAPSVVNVFPKIFYASRR